MWLPRREACVLLSKRMYASRVVRWSWASGKRSSASAASRSAGTASSQNDTCTLPPVGASNGFAASARASASAVRRTATVSTPNASATRPSARRFSSAGATAGRLTTTLPLCSR